MSEQDALRARLVDVLDPWVHFIADDDLPGFRAATPDELADRVMAVLREDAVVA